MKKILIRFSIPAVLSMCCIFFLNTYKYNAEISEINSIREKNMSAQKGEFTKNTLWTIMEENIKSSETVIFEHENTVLHFEQKIFNSDVVERIEPDIVRKTVEDGKRLITKKKNDSFEYSVEMTEALALDNFFDFWENLSGRDVEEIKVSKTGQDVSYQIKYFARYCEGKQSQVGDISSKVASKSLFITVSPDGLLKYLECQLDGSSIIEGEETSLSYIIEAYCNFDIDPSAIADEGVASAIGLYL